MKNKNIVWKYIVILSLIFTILLLGRIYFDIKHHDNMLKIKVNTLDNTIKSMFNTAEQNLIDKYMLLNNHFMNHPLIYIKLKENKREELHKLLKSDYIQFQEQDKNLYVMHFFDTKNRTILRMHKPNSYGDDLTKKRPIVSYANKTKKQQYGFEVGKNGIVYRITAPFIHKDKHVGVLEFGIKPYYFIDMIQKDFDIKAIALVKTDALNHLNTKKEYPTVSEYSIISEDIFINKFKNKIDIKHNKQVIRIEDKTYLVLNNLNLHSYKGEQLSKIIIIKDITEFVDNNDSSLMLINTLTLIVFLFILSIIYIVLNRFAKEIKEHTKTISTLHEKSNYLTNKANTDELTKAFNKSYFDKYFTSFLEDKKEGVVIFFDIDHFKRINDTYGHLAGDLVLEKLSFTTKNFLRENDIFVRWGGEEFIIVIENINLNNAVKKTESFRKLVENTKFENDIKVTISAGVTIIKSDDTKENILERADSLLYKAKNNGRNIIMSD